MPILCLSRVTVTVATGGKSIEDECSATIKSGFKPITADAFMTKAGKLDTCSHIIYAVVRPWQGGHQNEINHLFTAVSKSLEIAAERKLSSVAIAGVDWGFPANVGCPTLLEAVAEFQAQQHHFAEILLIDNRDQVVNHFHENLAKQFGKQNVKIVSGHPTEIPIPGVGAASTSCMCSFHLIDMHRPNSDVNEATSHKAKATLLPC